MWIWLVACSLAPSPDDGHLKGPSGPLVLPEAVQAEVREVLAEPGMHVAALAADGGEVFVADYGRRSVLRVPLDGGAPVLVAQASWRVPRIALSDERVYWVVDTTYETMDSPRHDATIWSAPREGGEPVQVLGPQVQINDLVVEGAHLYWVRRGTWAEGDDGRRQHQNDSAVFRADLDGGGVQTLAEGLPEVLRIAVDADHVWMAVAGAAPAVAHGTLRRVPIAGGAVETLVSMDRGPAGLQLDGDHVYWSTTSALTGRGMGAIWRLPRSGGRVEEVVAGGQWPGKLSVRRGVACWTDQERSREPHRLVCRLADGRTVRLATADIPTMVSTDGDRVWLADLKPPRLIEVALPVSTP